jgi:hypothetical protein
VLRGAVAGVAAAAAWGAAEPALGRAFGVPYSDVRLLGAVVTRGPGWKQAGWAFHLVNGAVFGALFERLGGHGVRRAVAAAQLENALLWGPGMAVVDRLHPDRKSGAWPPLVRNSRVFAYEVATHALFGLALGVLMPQTLLVKRDALHGQACRAPRGSAASRVSLRNGPRR